MKLSALIIVTFCLISGFSFAQNDSLKLTEEQKIERVKVCQQKIDSLSILLKNTEIEIKTAKAEIESILCTGNADCLSFTKKFEKAEVIIAKHLGKTSDASALFDELKDSEYIKTIPGYSKRFELMRRNLNNWEYKN